MAKKIPAFSYTGAYRTQSDGRYWYILLLTSGTLTFHLRITFDTLWVNVMVGCDP